LASQVRILSFSLGFTETKSDSSLFIYHRGLDTAYLLLYVDDIVLTASFAKFLQYVIGALQREFAMLDMGQLHHFWAIHLYYCRGPIRGTLKAPKSQLVTPISTKLQRPDGCN
jgi:hypothetical protein